MSKHYVLLIPMQRVECIPRWIFGQNVPPARIHTLQHEVTSTATLFYSILGTHSHPWRRKTAATSNRVHGANCMIAFCYTRVLSPHPLFTSDEYTNITCMAALHCIGFKEPVLTMCVAATTNITTWVLEFLKGCFPAATLAHFIPFGTRHLMWRNLEQMVR